MNECLRAPIVQCFTVWFNLHTYLSFAVSPEFFDDTDDIQTACWLSALHRMKAAEARSHCIQWELTLQRWYVLVYDGLQPSYETTNPPHLLGVQCSLKPKGRFPYYSTSVKSSTIRLDHNWRIRCTNYFPMQIPLLLNCIALHHLLQVLI